MRYEKKCFISCVFLVIFCLAGCAHSTMASDATSASTTAKVAPALMAVATKLETGADPKNYTQGRVRADAQGRLQVYVHLDAITPDELSALGTHGLADMLPSPALHVVQGWVKPQDLNALAALPFVTRITPPAYGYPR